MRDYDGFISGWLEAEILPANLEGILEKVKEYAPRDVSIVEVGCGKGILAAAMALEGFTVTAVDKVYPAVTEPFAFLLADANSDEFFSLLAEGPTVVGRRSFCLFYSEEWMEKLNATPVSTLIIESLDGERHRFRNSIIEAKFLEAHGWAVEVDGKYIVASRTSLQPTPPRKRKSAKTPSPEVA